MKRNQVWTEINIKKLHLWLKSSSIVPLPKKWKLSVHVLIYLQGFRWGLNSVINLSFLYFFVSIHQYRHHRIHSFTNTKHTTLLWGSVQSLGLGNQLVNPKWRPTLFPYRWEGPAFTSCQVGAFAG